MAAYKVILYNTQKPDLKKKKRTSNLEVFQNIKNLEMRDLFHENFKTLNKEIKELRPGQ